MFSSTSRELPGKGFLSTFGLVQDIHSLNDFDKLFYYINKNRTIKGSLASMTAADRSVMELKEAVMKGDSSAEIFNDPKCYLYLLFLIKTNEITFHHGMSVYVFLLALMQFTERQPLREEDADVKYIRNIEVQSLNENGKLTEFAKIFLKSIIERLDKMGQVISFHELEHYILSLSPVEQWLMKIPYDDSTDIFMRRLVKNFPLVHDERIDKETRCFYFPSITLIHYIIDRASAAPMRAIYCYGDLNPNTVRMQHERNCHPVSIYGQDVKTNPKGADRYRCGPFLMLFHDEFHRYGASLLEQHERDFIYMKFIPALESLCKIAEEFQDEPVAKLLKSAIARVDDFNLSSISDYDKNHKKNRLHIYLARSFGGFRDNTIYPYCGLDNEKEPIEFKSYGLAAQDRLYFLIYKHYLELPASPDKTIWGQVIWYCQTGTGFRLRSVVDALKTTARLAVKQKPDISSLHYLELRHEQWNNILSMIDSVQTGKEFCDKILASEHHYLLPALITSRQLEILPPYFPLTSGMMAEIRQIAVDELQVKSAKFYFK